MDIKYFEQFCFSIFPYMCIISLILISILRYTVQPFTYSTLSTQFLENKKHFLALVTFHYGLLFVLLGHIVFFLFPQQVVDWNRDLNRLYILEYSGLVLSLIGLLGLLLIIYRRITDARTRVVTSYTDWILYMLLVIQIGTGILIAVYYKWGASWFASVLSPYLWSLVKLNPDLSYILPLPTLVKAHMINGFLIFGYLPFTRLVHLLVTPLHYFVRRTQVVRWYWNRKTMRNG